MTSGAPTVSALSRTTLAGLRRTVIASSEAAGWTSLLIEQHLVHSRDDVEQLPPTPDQTVIVGLRGGQLLEVHGPAGVRTSEYLPDTVGFTAPGEGLLLRRRPLGAVAAFEKINLYLPADTISEVQEELRQAGASLTGVGVRGGPTRDAQLRAMVVGLLDAARWRAPELYAATAAQWLSVHLITAHPGRRSGRGVHRRPGDSRVAPAIDLMKASFAQPLTLDELAGAATMSKFHFVRTFRSVTGYSPHAYLVRLRLDVAASLLRSTRLSVREIAARCGFGPGPYFGRAFVQALGCSPAQYREDRGRSVKSLLP